MAVNAIREDDSKGRHTTTHRQLIRLKSGVMIIDTPGMRELGMWEATEGLSDAFADVEQFLGKCRFSDCKHGTEPGCAIRSAISAGELELSRWDFPPIDVHLLFLQFHCLTPFVQLYNDTCNTIKFLQMLHIL